MLVPHNKPVSLLILGAGWTSKFLIPLLKRDGISFAATTTNGRNGTIPFKFDPTSDDTSQFEHLPSARTVLITFPLEGKGQAKRLVELYTKTHNADKEEPPNYIQLGVTSIWTAEDWNNDASPYNKEHPRAIAEDELMACAPASVLSLAGLYGAERQPRNWLTRVVTNKDVLRNKGCLHVIHGLDVAHAIVKLYRGFTPGKRWMLCDLHVYDWWDLAQDWAARAWEDSYENCKPTVLSNVERSELERERRRLHEILTWLNELRAETGLRALPRDTELLGRKLDGRGFWEHFCTTPRQGRMR